MFEKSHDITVLNSLIETTIDSADGYRRSAEEATNREFAAAFLDRAGEREQVVAQLRERVSELGGTPEEDGSILAAAHRQFLSLRDAVTSSQDDHAVIAEVDRGETWLDTKWQAALQDGALSSETQQVIRQGYQSVHEGRMEWETAHRVQDSQR